MEYLVTFLEGIITFISPCLLPMLPLYVAYFAGGATGDVPTSHTMRNALGFILGFTLLFVLLGAFTGTVGSFFRGHQVVFDAVCGIIVILFGLNYAGILRIPALERTIKPKSDMLPRSFWSSVAFGIVFAIGWTPCVGVFLGSALALAAASASTFSGILLLVCYSLGLGLPFLITALLIDRLEGAFTWVKNHYRVINTVCGILLVVLGVLMVTGYLGAWMSALNA